MNKDQNDLLRNVENNMNPEISKKEFAVFGGSCAYISCTRVYFAHFEKIPSIKAIENLNYRKVIDWMESEYSERILRRYMMERFSGKTKKMNCENVLYVLKQEMLIDVENDGEVHILFQSESESQAQLILSGIKKFRKKPNVKQVSIIVNSDMGLRLSDIKNKKPKISLSKNYNDDLFQLHPAILNELKKKDESGLILFHGAPGTGKTTYIRYLIHCLNKRVIFLPPRLAGNLESPVLTNMLLNNQNSVLVIEDAEELVVSRESNRDSNIAMLLNLTDGILGESLGTQIICTFNTPLVNIDKALLRKGRLKALYEFKPLAVPKATSLLQEMGITNLIPKEPMTLADVYHSSDSAFEFKNGMKRPIGFLAAAA